jgi:hypothetical protein
MSDSILNSCDPITTLQEAQAPVVTMLLPVSGLRHNENGDLTADAVQIITTGIANLGIKIDSEEAQTALLKEAKQVLCNLNAQYEFLISTMFTAIKNSKTIPKSVLDSIKEKNIAMQDVISVSRQIVNGKYSDGTNFIEGFINNSSPSRSENAKTLEAFENRRKVLLSDFELISEGEYNDIQRSYEISVENNKSVSANLSLYSFLNVIAIGLLFYIVTAK